MTPIDHLKILITEQLKQINDPDLLDFILKLLISEG